MTGSVFPPRDPYAGALLVRHSDLQNHGHEAKSKDQQYSFRQRRCVVGQHWSLLPFAIALVATDQGNGLRQAKKIGGPPLPKVPFDIGAGETIWLSWKPHDPVQLTRALNFSKWDAAMAESR